MSVKELLLVAGMIFILGMATPVALLKLILEDKEEGCFSDVVLLLLAVPFVTLLAILTASLSG